MFEAQYNDEMALEVRRLEALARAMAVGHPEWLNACACCGCELQGINQALCSCCSVAASGVDNSGAGRN